MERFILLLTFMIAFAGCQNEEVPRTGVAKDHFYFENRGATMPVYVEGNLNNHKMLIVIHGGPGDGALYHNTPESSDIAESEFAIAYWDQRASGISQGNTMSVELADYTDDLRKLIILLRHRYGESTEFYLMAHSWGGLIASLFLEEGDNQRLINGWIQVDGTHNYPMNDSLTRAALIDFGNREIDANRNKSRWQEIVDYCVDHDPKNNYDVARKINRYANSTDAYISDVNEVKSTVKYFIKEYDYPITTFLSNGIYNHIIEKMEKKAYGVNVSDRLHKVTVPTLLLWGKYDFVCPIGLGEDITNRVSGTDVSTVIFNHSGHSPMQSEPVKFWNTVKSWVMKH